MHREHDATPLGEETSAVREVQAPEGRVDTTPKPQPDKLDKNVGDIAREIVKPLKEHEDAP